ncbi:MAG: IS1182 family transposase [Acidimicrobiales bacterium]
MRSCLVTKGSFYERLADHGHELVVDEDYAGLYSSGRGRPSVPPSVMVRAMLCATHDRTSDRETSRRTRVDMDWKAAMGVDDDFLGIAPTTFALMRARMLAADADAELFKATLAKAVDAGVLKGKLTAIIDSSPVHGAGNVADTYELIRKMAANVARAMGDRLDATLAACAQAAGAAKADIDWGDPDARRAQLRELVGLAVELVAAAGEPEVGDDPVVAAAADLLAQVVDQDVVSGDDGESVIRDGVAPDRIVSHSDPEMRHGRKSASRRFDGHKMDLITDEASELVLGVDVRAGNASDGDGAAPLLEEVTDVDGVEVETLLGDMAYSDGDVREAVDDLGVKMEAKVPPVTNGGRFPKTDFIIDTDTGRVTCPAGNTTTDAHKIKDHKGRRAVAYRFAADVCAACPLREHCTTGRRGRQIVVGRHHDRIEAARRAQHEPATKALLRRRSKVERKIDHLQDLGMRKARYRGRRKTRLQALLAATVANFKRLVVLDAFENAPAMAA